MQARLNSPRGKFETTWRASKEGQEQVELSPEDIPGTTAEQIKKLTVAS